jgi:hypothetical protein
MMILMIFGFWVMKFEISKDHSAKSQNSKTKSVVFNPPWETPSFLLPCTLYAISFHSNTSRLLLYIKEDYREKESLKKSQI